MTGGEPVTFEYNRSLQRNRNVVLKSFQHILFNYMIMEPYVIYCPQGRLIANFVLSINRSVSIILQLFASFSQNL